MYTAYFDRKTDSDGAILLVDQLKKDFHVPLTSLPSGSEPGHWFRIHVQNDMVTEIQVDEEKTASMKDAIQSRLNRLQSNSKSRFKRR